MGGERRIGLYCRSEVIGGAEIAMLNLAASASRSDELIVVSPSSEVLNAASRIAPGVAQHLVHIPNGQHPIRAIRRALRSLQLDLLQITLPNPFAARDAQLAAVSLRIPVVTVQQLVLASRRRRGAIVVRLLAVPIKATIAVGEQSGRDLVDFFGIPASKVHVVHNGVPAATPAPIPLDRRPVVGCVARYEQQKALHRLIDAIFELPDARLVLIGDGSLRDELQAQADSLGVADRVEINGWSDQARANIASFDVFALPSLDEAFPLTIVEAMLARTPVVATDVGSVSDAIIDEQTGLLVTSGETGTLVAAIRRLLGDRELGRRLADNAHDLATRSYTSEITAKRYREVWDHAVGASDPS